MGIGAAGPHFLMIEELRWIRLLTMPVAPEERLTSGQAPGFGFNSVDGDEKSADAPDQ